MDLLLRFKNKNYEDRFHEHTDVYLSKVSKTCFVFMIAVLPFFPYSEYVLIESNKNPGAEIVRGSILGFLFGSTLLIPIIIHFTRKSLKKHHQATRLVLDTFFAVFGGFYAYYFWIYCQNQTDPIINYVVGWLQAMICVLILSPISRWYLRIMVYLAMILRFGICSIIIIPNQYTVIKVVQLILIQTLVIYLSERDERKYFMEKQALFEETNVYKEIFELASDAVVIWGLEDGLLYHNWSKERYRWRNSEKTPQQNFEKIIINGYKKIADLPSSVELDLASLVSTSNHSNFWVFLEHLTQKLSPVLAKTRHTNNKYADQETLKPGYLMLLTGAVSQHSRDMLLSTNNFVLEIKVLLTTFKEKPSLILVFSDITERNLVTALQENNIYKDRLLASVSHELRTPLNASINFTQAAIEHPELSGLTDVRENYLLPALRSNQVLLHLINDILDFSQMNANKLRLVYETKDVTETLSECMNLLKIQSQRKGLKLSMEFQASDGKTNFATDHNRLKQIVLNLLSNSLKFTLKGEIKLTAKVATVQELVPTGSREVIDLGEKYIKEGSVFQKRALSVTVSDTGIGISDENKRKLFRAFEKIELGERMPINSHGVGLGLVISNNLVLMLGPDDPVSKMKVESEEKKGSTFSFWVVDKPEEDQLLNQNPRTSLDHSENICSEMDENVTEQDGRMETIASLLAKKTQKHGSQNTEIQQIPQQICHDNHT